ncbi:hypothetical protein [Sorangium sp. So ce406]|uniref:hypothetical protein n=1 Tax=Sorangium sp. So ce406 TaxID=3133311 RepID=UPI003F5C3DC8
MRRSPATSGRRRTPGGRSYDGKRYRLIKALDSSPAGVEQVYSHTSDPDVLFHVDGKDLIRYHVGAWTKDVVTTFDFCSGGAWSRTATRR